MMMANVDRRRGMALGLAVGAAALILTTGLEAGGALGWADSVNTMSEEGQGAGAAAIPLIVIGIGVIIAFSLQALAGIAISALGGAVLVGNALNVSSALVPGAGAGGGSFTDAIVVGDAHLPVSLLQHVGLGLDLLLRILV